MEDFVTFEIAKKLKEKGFREKCENIYLGGELTSNRFLLNRACTAQVEFSYNTVNDHIYSEGMYVDIIDAPTISQVLKWLREEKDCHIMIDIYDNGWFYTINNFYRHDTGVFEVKTHLMQCLDYDTYEQAAIAGIEYVIDNLI